MENFQIGDLVSLLFKDGEVYTGEVSHCETSNKNIGFKWAVCSNNMFYEVLSLNKENAIKATLLRRDGYTVAKQMNLSQI